MPVYSKQVMTDNFIRFAKSKLEVDVSSSDNADIRPIKNKNKDMPSKSLPIKRRKKEKYFR